MGGEGTKHGQSIQPHLAAKVHSVHLIFFVARRESVHLAPTSVQGPLSALDVLLVVHAFIMPPFSLTVTVSGPRDLQLVISEGYANDLNVPRL